MNRRRLLLAVTTAVVVIAPLTGSVVVTDRAEQRISRAAACRLAPVGHVSATLDSPLASVNLLRGSVGDVDIHASGLKRRGMSMALDAHLRQVTTSGATHGGDATLTIPYAELAKRLPGDGSSGTSWAPGTDGKGLTLTANAGSLGVPVTVHTDIALEAGNLVVTPTELTALGRTLPLDALPGAADGTPLAQRLKPRTIPLPALPSGVRATSAQAGEDGLALRLDLTPGVTRSHAKATDDCAAV
ncbi:LmeA family phospholipid-binding protein [Streptomyces sp. NPDC003710]